jgi:hypothetical protein
VRTLEELRDTGDRAERIFAAYFFEVHGSCRDGSDAARAHWARTLNVITSGPAARNIRAKDRPAFVEAWAQYYLLPIIGCGRCTVCATGTPEGERR